MDTVTYPASDIRAELEHWVFRKVDITEHRSIADLFSVTAIPIAIAVTGDGQTLARISNFVEPALFGAALRKARAAGSNP